MKKIRNILFPVILMCVGLVVNAQATFEDRSAKASAAIRKGGDFIKGLYDVTIYVMYAIAAILAVVGAIKVFSKWQSGDPDTMKVAASWFGAAVFIAVVGAIIDAFFLS